MPAEKTHQDHDGLLYQFASAPPLSITAAFGSDDQDDEYHNWALQESESCPTCGEHHPPEQTAKCPYGGCYDGEHCPNDCPYESGHTNWDQVYPHLPDTMHRGMSLRLPHDFDPAAPPHRMARTIAENLREYGSGTHWTPHEHMARHYAAVSHRNGDDLHVILHAAKPDRDDIEEDPHELLKHDVIGFGEHPDAEIPLQRGVPVHLTGISYRRPDQKSWTRHDFKTPMEHRAVLREAMPSTKHPRPDGFYTTVRHEPRDTDQRGWHGTTMIGHHQGRQVTEAYFHVHPHGDAIDIHSIITHDGHEGHGYASALMDDLYATYPHAVINHGARTDNGTNWWQSYEDPAPDRNTHNMPASEYEEHFDPQEIENDKKTNQNSETYLNTLHHTAGGQPWLPHDRYFGPGHPDLDPRLFDGTQLKPAWRRALLGLVNRAFADYTYRVPGAWQRWARAYLAGSQASHWYGNNDLDVLVGIDYNVFRRAQPRYRTMSDRDIDEMLNARAHEVCDPARWFTINGQHLGPFDSTVYINPDSFDIRKIKPYAAYDLGANRWTVEPMEVPDDFGPDKLPTADFLYARSLASQVRSLKKLPAGQAQALGAALYDKLHGERHDAFSGHGGGLYDVRNVAWKYLALHPEKPMEQLVAWKRAEQAEPGAQHTAGTSGPGSDADFNDDSVMIALVPPRDVAERLVLPDGKGEPADQMHITLAYIPHVPPGDLGRLTGTVAEWASRQRPIVARVQGAGTFVNPGKHVLWGAVDIPGSSHLHSSLVDALRAAKFQPSTDHGFTAHLTISYEKYHVRFLPKIDPVSFTCHSVYVCQGDNWRPVPVGGSTGGKVT